MSAARITRIQVFYPTLESADDASRYLTPGFAQRNDLDALVEIE